MEEVKFDLTLVAQSVGSDICLGEFLLVPELTSLGSSHDAVWHALRTLGEKFFADLPPGELWQRCIAGKPEPLAIPVALSPGKRDSAWRATLAVEFHGVRWKRPEGGLGKWSAYVPLLQAAAVADTQAELAEALEREIRMAIVRGRAENSDALTLRSAVMLARVEGLEVEHTQVTLSVKTPKAREREETGDKEEKSVLQDIATNLNHLETPKAFELHDTVAKIAEALAGRSARSVLLVGPSGVGKTAALRELVRTRDSQGLGDRTFWETSGSRLILGALGYGMWQERCHKFCREAAREHAIVYFGNLIELLEIGKSESNAIGIAGQLRGYMQRGELLAIAECTPEQLGVLEREDPHLLAAFRQVVLEEPSAEKTRAILQHVAADLTSGDPRRRGRDAERLPVVAHGALEEIERLHRRYASYSGFPGRPIRFLRNLIRDHEARSDHDAGATITSEAATAAFARETGLPSLLLDESVTLDADEARAWFASRVLAQGDAVTSVVDVLARVKAALNKPRRPIASLLFIGPTGVGKTEMAKALAEYFFSDRARLTRFDMSEFATPAAVTRLVGGWGVEGLLTAKVRQQPFSVVLLDEVEKAHASFFDLMLQVLGEGRLTDAAGRTADFSNTLVIMTSNLGAATFGRGGFGLRKQAPADAGEHFIEEVRAFLRPELFNRLDRIVPFLPLDAAAIAQVARREVELVRSRDGLRLREIALELAEPVVARLAGHGFDPAFGARPLKRAIERELLAPLADALNIYSAGIAINASVSLDGDALSIHVRAADAAPQAASRASGVATAQRAGKLRRQLQRLLRSGTMLQVKNEIHELERRIDRVLGYQHFNDPQLPGWRDRLKRIKAPSDEADALAAESIALEESVLIGFYEHAGKFSQDDMTNLPQLESRL
ncbi:MAG TPA: AAA family ATPase, partial [Phycisphaerae bacterium]|nr:AAA family ATPase [Phycisphaerae bacterium]